METGQRGGRSGTEKLTKGVVKGSVDRGGWLKGLRELCGKGRMAEGGGR